MVPGNEAPSPCLGPFYSANLNDKVKVLDFVKSGGPKWIVGGTVFEMWLGSL